MQVVVADSSIDTGQAEQIVVARLRALEFVLHELGLTLLKTTEVHWGHLLGRLAGPQLQLSMEPSSVHPHSLSPFLSQCG